MGSGGLEGRIALVAGASRGIGRAIVLGLADAGADVIGLARTKAALEELGTEVSSRGREFLAIVSDLSDVEAIPEAAARAWAWHGRVDVLVNSAGMIIRTEPPDVTPAEWDRLFALNTRAAFFLVQAVGGRMFEGQGGAVVLISSLAAETVTRASVMYQASKAAVVQMTRALAVRWGPKVRVNAVGPGYIKTSLNAPWLDEPANLEYVVGRTPLGRVGRPEDVVGAVIFLASPAAEFVTGQHLLVDGGWSAQ